MKLRLGPAAEFARESIRRVEVPGHEPVAVVCIDGRFFAVADNCRHKGASLAAGELVQTWILVCPWHEGGYDVRTGMPAAPPCRTVLPTFPVTVEDGCVVLELADSRGRIDPDSAPLDR